MITKLALIVGFAVLMPTFVTGDTALASSVETVPQISQIEHEDPTSFLTKARQAWLAKEWGVVVGFLLMLLVYIIVSYLWTSFPARWLPYMSIVIGVLGEIGWQLSVGGAEWWRAILAGLTTGISATGAWEIAGKKIFGRVSQKQKQKQKQKRKK